ncbi:uncharacterized protein LOC142819709 isoform X2 [Pelodiscus sinensis]|uniref:uncharacterized protein LOC142819709 isoform X2 n=1 Tax=Pelodiscus sinensis TaxID=13735 RepID=UPI003F6D742B
MHFENGCGLFGVVGTQSPITAQYGKNVILNCSFLSIPGVRFQRLNITWLKESDNGPALLVHQYYWGMDRLYKQDKGYQGRTKLFPEQFPEGNASLRLRSVCMQDEGSYRCSVESELQSSSRTMSLFVIREAVAEETIRAQAGEDVTLNCSIGPVSNHRLLNITWKKGPELLVHSYFSQWDQLESQAEAFRGRTQLYPERFPEGNASLRLRKVCLADEGFYTCHVKLEQGRFSVRIRLSVQEAPENGRLLWLLLLLRVLLVCVGLCVARMRGHPSILRTPLATPPSGQYNTVQHSPDGRPQRPAGNGDPRCETCGSIQSSSEAGDHETRLLNPSEEDCAQGSKEQLLSPDADSADLPENGGEELGAAGGTRDLSDSSSGSQESPAHTTCNIALLGETGSGKSSFINTICGWLDDDADAAQTGVINTTRDTKGYEHPRHPNFTLWDMPGITLGKFLLQNDIDMSKYDVFLLFSSDYFTPLHASLAWEIQQMKKMIYFVRSKVDLNLFNSQSKKEGILEEVRKTCIDSLTEGKVHKPQLFLLSCIDHDQHDFPCLEKVLGCD